MISLTMTATRRPAILSRTLASFFHNLSGFDCIQQIFINIDPLPDNPPFDYEMVRVLADFFRVPEIVVIANAPLLPSFPAAVKWCWSRPQTKYFFHLEDDWELTEPFRLSAMIDRLDNDPNLSCVNLRAYDWPPEDQRICLSPGLFRTAHAKLMAERLRGDANPERQLRPVTLDNPYGGAHDGFKGVCIPQKRIIADIGRAWLHGSGWRKNNGSHFTAWSKE